MKVAKSLLLGAAAGLTTVAAAQAADLPTRKAAPVEYVRVCNAYGAGFFYIPGTDTCLKVGGLVLAQMRVQGSTQQYSMAPNAGAGAALGAQNPGFGLPGYTGFAPAALYASSRPGNGLTRDSVGYDATARIELDARTQTGWGTLRTFIRVQSTFGSGLNSTTGAYTGLLAPPSTGWSGTNATIGKEFTYLDKAFIQFAGITAGRVQSFFDFYVDQYSYEPLRGSNQTVWALAYTATFSNGLSATLSVEDPLSHRGPVANTTSGAGWGNAAAALSAVPAASRIPDVIANLRVDQAWGAVQLAAALHQVRSALYTSAGGLSPFQPLNVTSKIGYALSAGVQFKLDWINPGDQLWLQAIYSKGAIGYVSGTNMAFTGTPNLTSTYGQGLVRQSNVYGWTNTADYDCAYTYSGNCQLSTNYAITGAYKHFWTPTLSSALAGSYLSVNYGQAANSPIGVGAVSGGLTNYREIRLGTNLVWTPVRGFDIGGEIMWIRGMTSRPFGLAPDYALTAAGLPTFKGTNDSFFGKIRMIRAF